MNAIRRLVVATLLAVWCFPAAGMATPSPRTPAPIAAESSSPITATSAENSGTDTASLAAREQQARQLQDFKGGRVIYVGSVVVILLVVLLVLLLV